MSELRELAHNPTVFELLESIQRSAVEKPLLSDQEYGALEKASRKMAREMGCEVIYSEI